MFKDAGEVSTVGGLTVLGEVTTEGKRNDAYVNAAGPLVAYVLRLETGGGVFKGTVTLIGSLPTRLGGAAVFKDILKARGTVIIDNVTLEKGATFDGPVEFAGDSNSVQIATGQTITLNGTVTITNDSPVDITGSSYNTAGVKELTYNNDYTTPATVEAGSVGFDVPVTFNKKATIGTQAYFNKGVTFGGDAIFSVTNGGDVHFGTDGSSVVFAKNVILPKLAGGSISAKVTFNGDATADDYVIFVDTVTANKDLKLGAAGGSFAAAAKHCRKLYHSNYRFDIFDFRQNN